MRRRSMETAVATFWAKVDQSAGADACWPWTGATFHQGHGRAWFDGRDQQAHRVAFALAGGELADDELLRHRCDNPPCCNPRHLLPGSHLENMADMRERGRASRHGGSATGDRNGSRRHPERRPRGESQPAAKLTEQKVREIRRLFDAGSATTYQLADQFGVTQGLISQVVRRAAWKHVQEVE